MQVKKYEARTMQEALDTIKRELGPEAIILKTRENKRGFGLLSKGSIEVTVAVSDRSLSKKDKVEKQLTDTTKKQIEKTTAKKQADLYEKVLDKQYARLLKESPDLVDIHKPADVLRRVEENRASPQRNLRYVDIPELNGRIPPEKIVNTPRREQLAVEQKQEAQAGRNQLETEVRQLRQMILEMKTQKEDTPSQQNSGPDAGFLDAMPQALQTAYEGLVLAGVDRRSSLALIKRVAQALGAERSQDAEQVQDRLADELMQTVEVYSLLGGVQPRGEGAEPTVIALIGPTGVGKTTTIAKIAGEAILKRKLKVGLINVDTYKVAAADQLGTYAKILSVPFRTVANREELTLALKDFGGLDLVLVDTTGRSQKDTTSLMEMEQTLNNISHIRTCLLMAANTRDTELYDTVRKFSLFKPMGVLFSKLDECLSYGGIYNVCQKMKVPLLFFTSGQRVPEDIEEATAERLTSLILEI